jgi:hypothetical protein
MNLTGPYWIGAIRLCFRGQEQINMSNILRQLDICQFYFTFNEAIGKFTSLPIVFIKNINMTQPLKETYIHGNPNCFTRCVSFNFDEQIIKQMH